MTTIINIILVKIIKIIKMFAMFSKKDNFCSEKDQLHLPAHKIYKSKIVLRRYLLMEAYIKLFFI